MLRMREATPQERRRYYSEEWKKEDLPKFFLHTLSLREFAFDHDGNGPNDRYNSFVTVEELSDFLREKAPYAVYGSVALYERPSQRRGWLKSELVFDIDAKDLPMRRCDCDEESVCEVCLDDARRVAAAFGETLRSDLGLNEVYFVYSGRGFHIRVSDDSVTSIGQSGRSQVVKYVTGGALPSDMTLALGYSKVFRKRLARTFERLDEDKLSDAGLRNLVVRKLLKEKNKVLDSIRRGHVGEIQQDFEGIGEKSFRKFLDLMVSLNSQLTDGKVTIDTKRILRLPSSLHSTVSRKCMIVKDLDNFSLDEAVPQFLREGES